MEALEINTSAVGEGGLLRSYVDGKSFTSLVLFHRAVSYLATPILGASLCYS